MQRRNLEKIIDIFKGNLNVSGTVQNPEKKLTIKDIHQLSHCNIFPNDIKYHLEKCRYFIKLPNHGALQDRYMMIIQSDDICDYEITEHKNCSNIHWINNKMICSNPLDLSNGKCTQNADCELIHVHKQKLFDRFVMLFIFMYHQYLINVNENISFNGFTITLDYAIDCWYEMYYYSPIYNLNSRDLWVHLFNSYNVKNGQKYWNIISTTDGYLIKLIIELNHLVSSVCRQHYMGQKCPNMHTLPLYKKCRIIHPILCNNIHISNRLVQMPLDDKFMIHTKINLSTNFYKLSQEKQIADYNLSLQIRNLQYDNSNCIINVNLNKFKHQYKYIQYNVSGLDIKQYHFYDLDQLLEKTNQNLMNIFVDVNYDLGINVMLNRVINIMNENNIFVYTYTSIDIYKIINLVYTVTNLEYFIVRFMEIFRFVNSRKAFVVYITIAL